jgi:ribosomal protein L25 (general stress protein Ctc)
MSEQLAIDAKLRSDLGKGASRRLRRNADTYRRSSTAPARTPHR